MTDKTLGRAALVSLALGTATIGCTPSARMDHVSALSDGTPKNAAAAAHAAAKARTALVGHDTAKAIDWAERAVAASPNNADDRLLLGQAYLADRPLRLRGVEPARYAGVDTGPAARRFRSGADSDRAGHVRRSAGDSRRRQGARARCRSWSGDGAGGGSPQRHRGAYDGREDRQVRCAHAPEPRLGLRARWPVGRGARAGDAGYAARPARAEAVRLGNDGETAGGRASGRDDARHPIGADRPRASGCAGACRADPPGARRARARQPGIKPPPRRFRSRQPRRCAPSPCRSTRRSSRRLSPKHRPRRLWFRRCSSGHRRRPLRPSRPRSSASPRSRRSVRRWRRVRCCMRLPVRASSSSSAPSREPARSTPPGAAPHVSRRASRTSRRCAAARSISVARWCGFRSAASDRAVTRATRVARSGRVAGPASSAARSAINPGSGPGPTSPPRSRCADR